MEKTRYSITYPGLVNIYLHIKSYGKHMKENSNPRKLAAPIKTQAIDNPTPANQKEENTYYHQNKRN